MRHTNKEVGRLQHSELVKMIWESLACQKRLTLWWQIKIIQEKTNKEKNQRFEDRAVYDPQPISVKYLLCYYRHLKGKRTKDQVTLCLEDETVFQKISRIILTKGRKCFKKQKIIETDRFIQHVYLFQLKRDS